MTIINVEYGDNLDSYFEYFIRENTIYLAPGNYYLSSILKIQKNNFTFKGTTDNPDDVHIYQRTDTEILLVEANNVTISGISFHVDKISEKTCVTFASCNQCNVTNCNFYGSDFHFTVFFAGPNYLTKGQNTIDGYLNNTLNNGNVFESNSIYSNFIGDGVSFSLQNNGSFINNHLIGCKIAIYMDKNCNISNNTISYSNNSGIFFSLPLENILVENNLIIRPQQSGMVFRLQLEHGEFINDTHNITIRSNTIINSQYMGIECNYTDNIDIINNKIISPSNSPLYTYKCSDINLDNNDITFIKYPVRIENTNHVTINNNKISICDFYPSNHGIFIINSNDISIIDNIITGQPTSIYINQIDSIYTESGNNIVNHTNSIIKQLIVENIIT